MAGKHEQSPEHRKAHDLADKAIDTAISGDTGKARDLARKAGSIDPRIGEEMTREVEEDRRKADTYKDDKAGG